MGRYNPHVPQILGQEWVPIREDVLTLTPSVNLIEVGHEFTLETPRTLQTARFYVQEWPPGDPATQAIFASIYRRGTETLTGPVRSVVVPCSLGTVTAGTVTISGATTIAQALANPSDSAAVVGNTGSLAVITLRFETDSYMPLLVGKRILGIDFLYASYTDNASDTPIDISIGVNSTGANIRNLGTLEPTSSGTNINNLKIGRVQVGEVDYHWNAPSVNTEKLPWSPTRLRGWDNSSGATDRYIELSMSAGPTASQTVLYDYAALEIFFCEEQRVAWGGKLYSGGAPYILGANQLTMRDLTDTANPVLPAGNYSLVISSPNQQQENTVAYPELSQLRQLYSLPTHMPIRINVPFPMSSTALGKTFEEETTTLLPQLSLHASGGPLTEVHVYGRQAAAQVYGSITATQEVMDSAAQGAASYPWVRFYARRFGETTVPLLLDSPSIASSTVQLTPTEFDELDEIVDGWKEVTLRFDTAPTMGSGTQPQWRWSATGELPGNRWEVLGAIAPALSGAPGNLFNLVPSPHQLSIATYGMPASGSSINLGWIPQYAPPVSATVDDQTSDASILFALDMPTITGFSVVEADQEVTGIGLNCGVDPCCIPSEIQYARITWGLPTNTGVATDLFNRTVAAGGWGTASDGKVWTTAGTAANFSVSNGQGQIAPTALGSDRLAWVNVGGPDQDVTTLLRIGGVSEGTGPLRGGVVARLTDSSNYYSAVLYYTSTQTAELRISKRVGGSASDLMTLVLPTLNPNELAWRYVRLQIKGIFIKAKVWGVDEDEPDWMLETSDVSLLTGNNAGAFARDETTGAGPTIFYFDNFTVRPPDYWFGHYELQRMDTVDGEWQTIMKATNPATTGFSDYESRVGILSSYRIRGVDIYDFPGPWSSTVTLTLSTPGVTIGCDDGHLLIFTSNEEQDGSLNLAYSSVWEQAQTVEETFSFPESQFVQLQAMYNRDFFTAFRPTERGGEQFRRTVLVQAAAISPETLADFTGLRDMAWANTSYICVRDEDGNRWFATVIVPSGRVLRDRRLYLAPVDIIEVTATPSEVDP